MFAAFFIFKATNQTKIRRNSAVKFDKVYVGTLRCEITITFIICIYVDHAITLNEVRTLIFLLPLYWGGLGRANLFRFIYHFIDTSLTF